MSVETRTAALRRAGPLAIAGAAANAASVVVTVVVARLLEAREYGALAQLIGLFLVLSMPGSALLVAVVRRATAWEAAGEGDRVEPWGLRVRRLASAALAGFAALAVVCRWAVADALSLPGASGVAEVLTAGAGWALLSVDRGLLQARRAYRALGRNLLVEGIARTVVTIVLVAVGLGVEGAALGLLVAMAVSVLDARRSLARTPVPQSIPAAAVDEVEGSVDPLVPPVTWGRRHLVADASTALAALALLATLQSLDVVILGREAPRWSGDYAAISVSSKALVFAAIVLSGYLLPEAAIRWHRGERAARPLGVALGLVAVPAAILVAIATVAPEAFLRVFFGERLTDAAPAFAELATAMFLLSGTVLFTHYLLGAGRRGVVLVLATAAVIAAVVLTRAGGDPVDTTRANLAVQASLVLATGIMAARVRHRGEVAS
jgi:O-antigen/teichoic acid export membrane protein